MSQDWRYLYFFVRFESNMTTNSYWQTLAGTDSIWNWFCLIFPAIELVGIKSSKPCKSARSGLSGIFF